MSPKAKYILAACAGLATIVVIGVAAIVLLRAKRSSAPEVLESDNTQHKSQKEKAAAPLQATSASFFSIPSVASSEVATPAALPDFAKVLAAGSLETARVSQVKFDGGVSGYRIEFDIPRSFLTVDSEYLHAIKKNNAEVKFREDESVAYLYFSSQGYKVYFILSALTPTTTGVNIWLVKI